MKHEFIVRASSVGDLMSKGRSKSELWGETAIKTIQKAILLNKYGIEDNFTSKYTEKGIELEYSGILMAKRVLGWDIDPDAPKQRLVNGYVIGEPDINQSILADIKNSWDGTTFPFFAKEDSIPNKGYMYQLQAYMWLSNKQTSELVYVLQNCTEQQIMNEVQKLTYILAERSENISKSLNQIEMEAEQTIRRKLTFDHIPEKSRVKRFIINRDEDIISEIKTRIEEARKLYDEFYETV